MISEIFSPRYATSHALIVGINDYKLAPPLGYAINDAEGVAMTLIGQFGFSEDNVKLLINKEATRQRIIESFLSFTDEGTNVDDRLFFFFAGHGHTLASRRGDVGYLIPYDGSAKNLSTLIRWDDLTRNSELIAAKHVLFIMDACYGGLAITRSLPSGSMRFLKEMLLRYTRQVLTAGKADEVVSDSGGPLPGHSIFTGHLLEALNGKAANEDGIITANGVMAYVYERVAKDQYSNQTPHFGFLDGDGDFVFKVPSLDIFQEEAKKDEDILIAVPSVMPGIATTEPVDIVEQTKEYLSDPKFRIKLHDLVTKEIKRILQLTSEDNFAVQGVGFSVEELTRRLHEYESIVENLQAISICISYWGDQKNHSVLQNTLTRLTDRLESQGGLVAWLALRWYPIILLLYPAGISAVAAENYDNLAAMLLAKASFSRTSRSNARITTSTVESILELERAEIFKRLPGHERYHVARSEYLFKLFQPILDDVLFLGREYEQAFDRFELMFALVYADLDYQERKHLWGPIGRFGWKYFSGGLENPLKDLMAEANALKDSWAPLKSGLFGGDYSRFRQIAEGFEQLVAKLNWW